jgi:hypothetical protein
MPGARFVFARTKIHSERDQVRKMKIGHSDEVILFLNGVPLYEGKNELGLRQGNFLGLLDGESDAVYLPLKKGDNELMLAITEFFGGWGFLCELPEATSGEGSPLLHATRSAYSTSPVFKLLSWDSTESPRQ